MLGADAKAGSHLPPFFANFLQPGLSAAANLCLSTGVGATYEVLADLLGDPTMLDDAVTNHRQALSVLDSRGQIGQVRTIVATNLANALARLSDVTADIQFCTEAIDLAERSAIDAGGGTVAYGALLAAGGAALTRFQLSIDHTGAGRSVDARKAIDFYREAVDRVSSDPLESPRAIGNLANALFSVGTALGQADMLHEAADLYERATVGGDDYALIQRLVNYAFVALSLAESTGNAEERTSNALAAEALFEDAVALASQNSTTSPLSRLRIQAGLIRSSALQGLWKKTAHYAEKGSEVLSEMASGPNPRLGGDTSLQAVSNLSGLGAAAHLRIGDFDAAIGLIEQTQAVHLRERIGQDALTVELAGRGHINLANELRSALRMERSTRSQGGHTYRSESRATALLIRAAHEALGSSDVSRAEEAFRTASDLGHPVVYLLGDYQTGYLLRLDPDGSTAIESADELSSSRIGRLSARFGRAVNNARTPATRIELRHVVNDVISELTKVAAGPLRDLGVHGGQSRLIPIGPFRGLPWHAVAIDGVPLIGHVPVSYLPSASLSHSSTRRQPGTGAVIIGQPTVDLPGVQPEVEAITEALEAADVDVLDLNGNESRSALLQAISDSRFLHVASHTNEQWSAGTSTLAISPTRTLAAADLLEIGLKAELTVLSACSTNRPDLLYPDGSVTLASVAYLAGSKAVLSTLWPVVDQWISETAPNVYERLLAGDDLPEALALSLQPHLHNEPYLWAPLHVIG